MLVLMKHYTGSKEIIHLAVTRFATGFLKLQSIFKVKQCLIYLFTSQSWISEVSSLFMTSMGTGSTYVGFKS